MKSGDLVSIITPSYNTANYIAETIKSIQRQSYINWELIIVDDCSTDNTDEVVSDFLTDERIRYFKNETNSGAALSRNYALRKANGRWIAFLDSDDIWMTEKLEKQIEFMEKNNCCFSYTNYKIIDETSRETGVIVTGPKKITKHGMYNYCWPGCLTVMYDALKIGLVQIIDIKKNNDYAMWLSVSKKADCYLLDDVLAKYRRGRLGSISSHNYISLVKWHYRLYRVCDNKNKFSALVLTCRNLFFGFIKKIIYVKG